MVDYGPQHVAIGAQRGAWERGRVTLPGVLAQLAARRDAYARLRAQVDAAALLDEVLELLADVDGQDGEARDLTTQEAAHLIGARSHRTVERYCREGRFPHAYKSSGASGDWRIPPADVAAYRAARRDGRMDPPMRRRLSGGAS